MRKATLRILFLLKKKNRPAKPATLAITIPFPHFPHLQTRKEIFWFLYALIDIAPQCQRNDTAVFRFVIKDKANHVSDTVSSPPIIIILSIKVYLKKLLEFILFSSIFISACAVGFCIETNILLGLPLNSFSFYCFVFGATLLQYNLHYSTKKIAVKNSERLRWSHNNKKLHFFLLVVGGLLILFSFFSFHLRHFIILACLGAISFLYSFPFLPVGKKKRIKDYGLLKIVTLSLLWTLVTVWFPVSNMPADQIAFYVCFCGKIYFHVCSLFAV